MKRIGLLLFAALVTASPAAADYKYRTGDGILIDIRAGLVSGKTLPYSAIVDAAGNPIGTSGNPINVVFSSPQHIICDSGCAGGGGSSYTVTFGQPIGTLGTPSGFRDGSGNFQALLGDVINGQWMNVRASVLPTGAATEATLASVLGVLGSPFQAGGSIANTSFGISGTLPAFAATPTFNLGTLNGAATAANQTSVIGPVAAGTAAANSLLAGGVFNSSPITVTNSQQAALQIDANGYLKVNVSAGAASGGTSSSFAAAFPATGTAVGMSQGGNMVALTGTSGNLNVQCANCSGSGVSTADGSTFTAGASLFAGAGGFFQTTATANPLTNGQQGMWQMTANRAGFVNLRTSAGAETGVAAAPLQVSLANTASNATAVRVDGSAVTQPVSLTSTTITGTVAVTQSGSWSLAANQSMNVAQVNGVTVLTGAGAVGPGSQRIALGQDATTIAGSAPGTAGTPSSNVVTVQGAPSMRPVDGNITQVLGSAISSSNPVPVSHAASATGGATPSFVVAANSNNSTSLKGSAGVVYGIQTSNINASTAYFIKLYDKATAPTCGTDTPVAVYVIPPANGGNNVVLPVGKQFTLGIGYCIVAGIANNDNTSVPAATVLANIDWK